MRRRKTEASGLIVGVLFMLGAWVVLIEAALLIGVFFF